jgi:hypothetical protein
MACRDRKFRSFRRLEPGLSAMGGQAAWAQTQLTPGVSVLAAPHPNITTHRDGPGQQGFHRKVGTLK